MCSLHEQLPDQVVDYAEIKIPLGQDMFNCISPLQYSKLDNRTPCAVRLPLGWVPSGPLPSKVLKQASAMHANTDYYDLAVQLRTWWDIATYAAAHSVDPRSKDDRRALEILESTTHNNGERYVVGILWAKPGAELPKITTRHWRSISLCVNAWTKIHRFVKATRRLFRMTWRKDTW